MTLFPSRRRGFTLIELLAVIGIIVLMLSFIAPGINGTMRGLSLTQQGNALGDAIALARQTAITKNREIELRLIKLPYLAETKGNWAFQLWEIDATTGTPKAMGALFRFQESIVISSAISPILAELPIKTAVFSGSAVAREYQPIRFRPNGRIVDQFGAANYLSLTLRTDDSAEADNFYTLQFNPITGGAQIYRP